MGFSVMISYDSAGSTMSQQNCLLHTRRARPWSFRRWTHFTRGTPFWAEGTSMLCLEPSTFTKLEEIRTRKTESFSPENYKTKKAQAASAQASSVSAQASQPSAIGGWVGP